MKAITLLMVTACAALNLIGMPTETETKRAEPTVRRLLAKERAALHAGKKTPSETADAAMKLAEATEAESAKLLMMKGAFVLYVRDRKFEKAIETIRKIKSDISAVPQRCIDNMIEQAFTNNAEDTFRIWKIEEGQPPELTMLFPGWSLDAGNCGSPYALGAKDWACRGRKNVIWIHPSDPGVEAVLSRTVTLSDKNPQLSFSIASHGKDWDFLLSVRVDGQEVISKRTIKTPDEKPWEDVIVPLDAWRGKTVKVEIATVNNNWYCEYAWFSRIEVSEDDAEGVQLWEGGPYWSECDVGATQPEETGYFFRWGDTVGYKRSGGTWTNNTHFKDVTWISSSGETVSTSPFTAEASSTSGKDMEQLRNEGYVDKNGVLTAEHDAATAYLGAPWRMPTVEDFGALIENCDMTWVMRKGVFGRLVTGRGDYASKSIFLPAAGIGWDFVLERPGQYNIYNSSTPSAEDPNKVSTLYSAWHWIGPLNYERHVGRSVRAVRDDK